jgi:hypothetical protein
MAKRRRPERVPQGLLPDDPNAPLDPVALWTRLRTAPLTTAQAHALTAAANQRERRAAAARETQHRRLMKAVDRGDWAQAGDLWRAQQQETARRVTAPVLAARDLAKGRHLGQDHNAKRQIEAAKAAERYVRQARALRRKHGAAWSLSAIIAHLRRTTKNPLSARQIRRHLAAAGIT